MFERKVLMADGVVRRLHRASAILHEVGGTTTVVVQSTEDNEFDANYVETAVEMPLDYSLDPDEAEEAVKALPEWAEAQDDGDLIEELADMLTDEQAATVPQAYPEWKPDTFYEAGKRLQHGGGLYRVLQSHTSQETWTPTAAPSLYAEILPGQGTDDPSGTYPEWVQPDSTNPFMKGDKVSHNGKNWESLVDNNVWEPGAVGTESVWREIG